MDDPPRAINERATVDVALTIWSSIAPPTGVLCELIESHWRARVDAAVVYCVPSSRLRKVHCLVAASAAPDTKTRVCVCGVHVHDHDRYLLRVQTGNFHFVMQFAPFTDISCMRRYQPAFAGPLERTNPMV